MKLERGFTSVELVIIVVVVGILVALTWSVYVGSEKQKHPVVETQMGAIEKALAKANPEDCYLGVDERVNSSEIAAFLNMHHEFNLVLTSSTNASPIFKHRNCTDQNM